MTIFRIRYCSIHECSRVHFHFVLHSLPFILNTKIRATWFAVKQKRSIIYNLIKTEALELTHICCEVVCQVWLYLHQLNYYWFSSVMFQRWGHRSQSREPVNGWVLAWSEVSFVWNYSCSSTLFIRYLQISVVKYIIILVLLIHFPLYKHSVNGFLLVYLNNLYFFRFFIMKYLFVQVHLKAHVFHIPKRGWPLFKQITG